MLKRFGKRGLRSACLAFFFCFVAWAAAAPALEDGRFAEARKALGRIDLEALRLAVEDQAQTFGERYTQRDAFLERLGAFEKRLPEIERSLAEGREEALGEVERLGAFQREALLANPLLDFERLLVVKRRPMKDGVAGDPGAIGWDMGQPRSSASHCALPRDVFDNEIAALEPVAPDGSLRTVFRPEGLEFAGEVDLHFDANRLLFSMRDAQGSFQLYEVNIDGTGLRQITQSERHDVDNFDACYLPDGRIVFCSSASFQSVPCNGSHVAMLYLIDPDGSNMRQLCFEQDHDFNPTMLDNGRILYTRWEYADLPHSNSRMMFSMNPDGTGQMEYYGSNSYWPNSFFAAQPLPGRPGRFVAIVAGHHGSHREGELVLFDAGVSRREAQGAIQRIPGRGKRVEPIIADELTAASWPKFCNPFPLNDKYFLVSCKIDPQAPWDIYLVDVFDNMLLLHHAEGYGLLEPIPLRSRPRPPAIPDKVDLARKDAVVYLTDVYQGGGLEGVPRGSVTQLRLITYHFSYHGVIGLYGVVGMDGPWDIKRVLGTVPVDADGSALFRVPANTPIAVQPLDADGRALQLMRSWFVGMPGETLSCVGCHEPQSMMPPVKQTIASRRAPSEIAPWRTPARNFSFEREIQPVLDAYCVRCHDGAPQSLAAGKPDLRGTNRIADWSSKHAGNGGANGGKFSVSYAELHRFVRRPGIESNLHMHTPMEYHASTTELAQMLEKGHHGVRLDAEAWDRLQVWIDLNTPFHGAWSGIVGEEALERVVERRRELRLRYAGVDENPEILPDSPPLAGSADAASLVMASAQVETGAEEERAHLEGWPLSAEGAALAQAQGGAASRSIDLGDGIALEMAYIPAGEFVMGNAEGCADERPESIVRIEKPFWMGRFEVTNAQFARFDAAHDSRIESKHGYQFGVHGYRVNEPTQPVVRVSWQRAMAFCRWLSERTGEAVDLPTEAEWEYACRAGSASAFSFGEMDCDFTSYANLGDARLSEFASDPYTVSTPIQNPSRYDDWVPKDARFNDGAFVSCAVGRYRPNAWGLSDMHGNVWEWTRSAYAPYPYAGDSERDALAEGTKRVARGGSWYDRPARARSSFRLAFRDFQPVFNVGFRIVLREADRSPDRIARRARR